MRKTLLILAVLLVAGVLFWRSTRTHRPYSDDPLWFHLSSRWPWHCREADDYKWSVDIPAFNRWCYGAVMKTSGFHRLPCPPPFVGRLKPGIGRSVMAQWQIPRQAELAMRATNSVIFAAGLALLWLAAYWGLRSWWLAALTLVPFLSSGPLFVIVHKIGADSFLAFGLALTLSVWQYFHVKSQGASWKAVVLVGVAAGVATGAKQNGGLALLAYAAYLAVHLEGRDRVIRPLAACAVAFLVFSLVNPVIFFSGRHPWTVIHDIVARRFEVIRYFREDMGYYSRWEIFTRAVPVWPLLPVLVAAQAAAVKRFRWTEPIVWWGAFVFLGTVLTINHPLGWYVAPAHFGLYFASAVAVIALVRRYLADNLVMGKSAGGDAKALKPTGDENRGGK